jgi:hypothetical protein
LNVAAACAIDANSMLTMAVVALRTGRADRRMIFLLCRHLPTRANGTFSKNSFRYRGVRAAPVGLSSPVSNSRQKKSDRDDRANTYKRRPSVPMLQCSKLLTFGNDRNCRIEPDECCPSGPSNDSAPLGGLS